MTDYNNNERHPIRLPATIYNHAGAYFLTLCTEDRKYLFWQKSFYDHVIRTKDEYRKIQEYIMLNPAKWSEDKFFVNP